MNAFKHGLAGRMLGTVDQDKICRLTNFYDAAIKLTHSGSITGGKTKGDFWRNITKAR